MGMICIGTHVIAAWSGCVGKIIFTHEIATRSGYIGVIRGCGIFIRIRCLPTKLVLKAGKSSFLAGHGD
jgi:hypothetical protein